MDYIVKYKDGRQATYRCASIMKRFGIVFINCRYGGEKRVKEDDIEQIFESKEKYKPSYGVNWEVGTLKGWR